VWAQPGFDYVDQPFDPYQIGSAAVGPHLGPFGVGDFADFLDPWLVEYVDAVLSGRRYVRGQWNVFDPRFSWRVDRLVIKAVGAPGALRYWAGRPDIRSVGLLRHPLAVALSTIEMDWIPTGTAFLDNESYVSSYLDKQTADDARSLLSGGDLVVAHMISWMLASLPILEGPDRPPLVVTYEALARDPGAVFDEIAPLVEIFDREAFIASVRRPTRTASRTSASELKATGSASRARLRSPSVCHEEALDFIRCRLGHEWRWAEAVDGAR
jgi:hypothetical protein